MDQLVVGPLQEGAVDRANRTQPFAGHARCQGDGMLLGNTDVHVLVGNGLLQQVEAGAGGHCRSDSHHATVLLAQLDEGLTKDLAVAGRLGFGRGDRLTRVEIEG